MSHKDENNKKFRAAAERRAHSDLRGAISGGGGFADSYYQPFILGWRKRRSSRYSLAKRS
jgi:hypothetical protein